MAKDILKEAIADAKAVREVALANAKAALEEAFTPKLQSMLSAKLSEELNEEDEIEENKEEVEEGYYEEDKEEVEENFVEEKTDLDEEIDLEEILNELELEEGEAEDTVEEAKDKSDSRTTKDIEQQDSKDYSGTKRGTTNATGVSKLEEENEDLDEAKIDEEEDLEELHMPKYKADDVQKVSDKAEYVHEEKEFNLDALLEEINNLDENEDEVNESEDTVEEAKEETNEWAEFSRANPDVTFNLKENGEEGLEELFNRIKQSFLQEKEEVNTESLQNELEETQAAFEAVKTELNEVNLLNSKLLYVNRIFKANQLDEAQKLRVVETLDKAESTKEAKLIYETIKGTFNISKDKKNAPKRSIREGLGMASKAAGTSTAPKKEVIVESNDMVTRMQKLANIKINQ